MAIGDGLSSSLRVEELPIASGPVPYSRAVTELLAGRYELVREITEGAVATLWRGAARGEGGFTRPVAVRLLQSPWDRDLTLLSAWAANASELAEHASPHVEQVLDVLVTGGRGAIVSEWIEGISLRRLLAAYAEDRLPLPWPLAASIAVDVLRGLVRAHEASPPLCHEGVDARSVRLSAAGLACLTRFGLAPALSMRGEERRALEERGVRHPAPELALGERTTPASDRFGVGALLFEMLAGTAAFPGAGPARDAAVRAGEIADLAALRPDVPALVVSLIERALRGEPSERFDSAEAMAAALVQLLRNERQPFGPDVLAAAVRAAQARVVTKKAPALRPQGLAAQRTMHVDLAELTVLPSGSVEAEPEGEESGADRRPRYRFGYKDRRANLAARTPLPESAPAIERQESEAAPLPLTRRAEPSEAAPPKRPQGLAAQRTEFLDADQVDALTLPDKKR